ncbi:bromo adjacent homology domain-containing 1 protein-like [Carassius auratus]|uniref:Bromo adjacent homology domain-containing 1 protein-like n=1 Tax=Carassius auratus TaxID=7957 RepID=A0A6P6P4E6_CARAU|nr:bromo adjacent homology domain-containing 1 protein-like [Carassius auratus]XP_026115585.1 bromo adjacent homology domain-containing 1 protein-like [Carassius auratus]
MTHARKNTSIGQHHSEGRGHRQSWSHGETVGGAWPAHSMQEGKAKKVKESQCLAERSVKMNESKSKKGKSSARSECHRKLYPLRGRSEALGCHVLLTRLHNETNRDPEHKKTKTAHKKAEKTREPLQKCLKTFDEPSAQEPRKRRLASLNAEALNSLLLEKTDRASDAKLTKKQTTTEPTKTCSRRAGKTETCPNLTKEQEVSLYAPVPRRLAGLNAAALLKLTSSTANKHRVRPDRHKAAHKPKKPQPESQDACQVCRNRSLDKPGYQSMLGYAPVELVKEEAELSPCFCCPPEYLTLFLDEERLVLCADPCCSSYYVHIARPGPSLSPAFCCRPACEVRGFTFSRPTCSCPCSSCSRPIKTEEEHSHTVSGCPSMPRVTPAVPSLLSSMSDRRLQMGKECPQNPKPPHGSLTTGYSRSSQTRPTGSAKQEQKATNGWRPVGVSTEKEVFIAGDDQTVLRQCYEGVERDGEVIRVRDTVLLRSGPRRKSLPYVAKISALWEDPRTGELMMSLFWYYRPEHTQAGRDPSMHCENEIFASRHQDENSVACIEERCYVLPLAQYCRFCALVKRRSEGVPDHAPLMPRPSDSAGPAHRLLPDSVDPQLVYLCRHVYDFRYGRILKTPQ